MLSKFRKGFTILIKRFREQGIRTSLLWLYGRGLPYLTGTPLLMFSQVTPQLYVGPQYRASGLKFLQSQGISAVVNLRIEKDDAEFGLAPDKYCYIPVVDDLAPTQDQIDKGVTFIDQILSGGGKVYIHCGAGVGRAPTMAAAYLMTTGMTMQESLATIRSVRPFIMVTPPQLEALRSFEKRILSRG